MRAYLTFEVYKGRDGWRWRAKRGGRIVADSGEAYTRRRDAHKAASRLFRACHWDARIVLENEDPGVRRYMPGPLESRP